MEVGSSSEGKAGEDVQDKDCESNKDMDCDLNKGTVGEDVEDEECEKNKDMGCEQNNGMDCGLKKNLDKTIEIKLGMEFDSAEDLYNLFQSYAQVKGFPIKKRSSKKDEDGVARYVRFACAREGRIEVRSSNSLRPRPLSGTGCRVTVSARFEDHGKWRIINVFLDHNHECSPEKLHIYRGYKKNTKRAKRKLVIKDQAGMDVPTKIRACDEEVVGYKNVAYISKDDGVSAEKMRLLRLGEGDAIAIRNYFLKMQKQNKDFYFSIDIDEAGLLESVFWCDARSRLAYKEFGEVVTFDTTYLTNKYDVPFVYFVGINHHGQSMLLGCGLVSHENTNTFTWLFSTWLACMHGCAPQGLITNQDQAMQNAIAIVFPNTIHRWCLWHILKKLPEKLDGHTHYHSIVHDLHGSVYDSQRAEDFEQSWIEMVDKYKLQGNPWLSGLYEDRCRWVPAYVKMNFWAGMSTIKRGESMNSFFDGHVNQTSTLKQFVEQFDSALRCKIEKETLEDCMSFSKVIPLATLFSMEKQVQSVYTISKFKEFQIELNGQIYCRIDSTRKEGTTSVYEIKELRGEDMSYVLFNVLYDSSKGEIVCSCHMFEYRGIVCRHVIYVLVDNKVKLIPDKYILRRWRKDVWRPHSRILITDAGWIVTVEQKRYDEMCTLFDEIADLASMHEEVYHEIMEWAQFQKNKLTKCRSISESNNPLSSS